MANTGNDLFSVLVYETAYYIFASTEYISSKYLLKHFFFFFYFQFKLLETANATVTFVI